MPDDLSEPPQSVPATAKGDYLTAPQAIDRMPPGIPYIVTNEAAERFSFYGMRGILVVFMTQHLLGFDGKLDTMTDPQATVVYHLFVFGAYAFSVVGAVLADAYWGKYRTIMTLSVVYCLGHLALALDETRIGLFSGLGLIALGSGGIKPCVSAHVGDQFGQTNRHLLEKVFGWFYLSINLGAFISTLVTPTLLENTGPSVAFAVPGVLMLMATIFFWMGRWKFVHIPASGMESVLKTVRDRENLQIIARLSAIYLCIAFFWSLYDQSGSTWVLQAKRMYIPTADLRKMGLSEAWPPPAAIQSVNPLLILIFIPLFTYVVYPAISKVFPLTPLRKIGIGFFLASLTFLLSAWIEMRLAALVAAQQPPLHIGWQLLAYVLITASEVMVSITALEFSYTQAPRELKSVIMAMYLLSISVGNLITSALSYVIQDAQGESRLSGAQYYTLFAGLMFVAALAFIGVARRYQERTHLQG